MGAAGVRPHVREGDLLRGPLLQEQLVLVVEEEDGEGAVQQALVYVGHQVACARMEPNWPSAYVPPTEGQPFLRATCCL